MESLRLAWRRQMFCFFSAYGVPGVDDDPAFASASLSRWQIAPASSYGLFVHYGQGKSQIRFDGEAQHNRKNWLFAGSMAGGERLAGFFTLVSSALRHDLDVWRYVNDVLQQLLSGITDYAPLLPFNWATAHPDSVRQYRQEERKDRLERKT